MSYKRILTIQDISCVGQCSLTVALPILSACGLETCVLPSAVLSTHTAGFTGFTVRDLTEDIPAICDHWCKEGIQFEAIYTGYLGSTLQIQYVLDIFRRTGTDNCVKIVDPAMADNGKLYAGFVTEFVGAMKGLCAKADVLVPNITEASFLLEQPYIAEGSDRAYIEGLLKGLTGLGPRCAVLTGVSFAENELGAAAYDRETDTFTTYFTARETKNFHGTGDLFASALVGALENGLTIEEGMRVACEYTLAALRATLNDPEGLWYGVNFEEALPTYLRLLGKI